MILKSLTLQNYKTYYGSQEIDLYIPEEERESKSIILFGGLNGAGKTTILDAIVYLLFGKRGLRRDSKDNIEEEYVKLFSNVVNHQYFDEGGRKCSVTLVFETDEKEEYEIRVVWHVNNHKRISLEERRITFKKAGATHSKVIQIESEEAFYEYIDKIIPFYASPFFLFDGEEIRILIEKQNSKTIKDAITKICGLNTNKILLDDLRSLARSYSNQLQKHTKNSKIKTDEKDLKKYQDEYMRIKEICEKDLNTRNKYNNKKEALITQKNEKLYKNTNSRDVLVKKAGRLYAELEKREKQLEKILDGNLNYLILSKKIKNLQAQLELEKNYRKEEALTQVKLKPYKQFMSGLLDLELTPPLTETQKKQLEVRAKEVWFENQSDSLPQQKYDYLHDLNQADFNFLTQLSPMSRESFIQLINEIQKYKLSIQELENEISAAPDALDTSLEEKEIEKLTKGIGALNLRIRTSQKKIQQLESNIKSIKFELSKRVEATDDMNELYSKIQFIERTISALEEYEEDYIAYKTNQIKEEFEFMLKQLFRKKDEFGKIEFDTKDFVIRIYNDRHQEISISDRSAGEKQMIASALIWAFTKSSGLKLPIVIDTPLGRLDSEHRKRLINNYYRQLSEQVIILSTDTEITDDYIDIMSEASYKQYLLDYDENKKYTIIRDGYFEFIGDVSNE